ncbi:polysaccharide biosynthesis/export family protein [Flavobacterium sp. LT1R49]|uniref:polysaccharide biosynthesis/export family protein n=1 Tax=Flavobacterium arabinosi TaxID=3398737 RepID=UPI003A8BC308
MIIQFPRVILVLLLLQVISSCTSSSKITYLQDVYTKKSANEKSPDYEPKLQIDDLLSIIVSADNPENTIPFNLPQIQGSSDISSSQNNIKTYLIDSHGEIDFPVIGKIKLAGLARSEANKKMAALVSEYIKNPGINLHILNFKVSVLGEVNRPESIPINSERITLLEALSKAGDLTIYGKRTNILVIREVEGVKTYGSIDITKSDFINSPFYYLAQNDVIVVHPNKTKINAAAVGPNTSVIISSISLLLTLLVLLKP